MMKKDRIILSAALAACLVVLGLTLFDFLALHDIRREYVSPMILDKLEVTLSRELPAWTRTSGEWGIVHLSWICRFFFLALNAAVLFQCLRRLRPIQNQG